MSLQKYIQNKFHQIKVHYDIDDYKSNIREHCFSIKNKRNLYEYFLDLSDLNYDLDVVKYPEKYKILLNISSPENSTFYSAFENFFNWSANKNGIKIRKLEEKITYLKSFYFLNEDTSLSDIDFVVQSKCSKILNNFKLLDIYIEESVQDTNFSDHDVFVKITNDNMCQIKFDNGFIEIKMQDFPEYVSEEQNGMNKNFEIIKEKLFAPRTNYFDFYFQELHSNRKYINEYKRNCYLNKYEEYFEYPLNRTRLPKLDNYDLWKIKLKLNQIKYDENAFRIKDCLQKVRYLEIEADHED